jgi:hypothetical protein
VNQAGGHRTHARADHWPVRTRSTAGDCACALHCQGIATITMPASSPPLTLDADRVLKLAAQSMFETFASTAMGTMVVDSAHRIVWIDDGYRRFLPALGHAEGDFVGRRSKTWCPTR